MQYIDGAYSECCGEPVSLREVDKNLVNISNVIVMNIKDKFKCSKCGKLRSTYLA